MEKMRENSIDYSQNFLKSPSLVNDLVDASSINPADTVYEIGSGTGVITAVLAERCKEVFAIEVDRGLYEKLAEKFNHADNISVVGGTFLLNLFQTHPTKCSQTYPSI